MCVPVAGVRPEVTGLDVAAVGTPSSDEYSTQCRWLLRAAWMAQEPLTTFEADLGEVALVPGSGGIFEVRANGAVLWSRRERGSGAVSGGLASDTWRLCQLRAGRLKSGRPPEPLPVVPRPVVPPSDARRCPLVRGLLDFPFHMWERRPNL